MISEQAPQQAITLTLKGASVTFAAIKDLIKLLARLSQLPKHGNQTVKQLNKQGQQLDNIALNDADLVKLRKDLKKQGVDFAIMENKETHEFSVWFKGKDTVQIHEVLKSCVANIFEKEDVQEKEPIKEKVEKVKEQAKEHEPKENHHERAEKSL